MIRGEIMLPKISIVTPSYHYAQFLEECICSVLGQSYPNLEYVVIDGGSSDGSVDIIRKYQERLTFWISEPDRGQYEAINRGFAKTTGEIMAWINADDKYTPWAFHVIGEIFGTFPEIEWLTTRFPLRWDSSGRAVACSYVDGYSRGGFLRGENLPGQKWYATAWIQQESTFWRRSLWERAGGYVDSSLKLAADFELWARFFKYADLIGVDTPLGGFRSHGFQKTARLLDQYLLEAMTVLRRHGARPSNRFSSFFRSRFLRRTPGRLKPLCNLLGLTFPYRVCRYADTRTGWVTTKI